MRSINRTLLAGFFMSVFTHTATSADLKIEISDLRNETGSIQVAIYDNPDHYRNDEVQNVFMAFASKVTAKDMQYTIHDVPNGKYAVTVIHDENGNSELDMEGRTPLEGLAYSGTKSRLTKPSFERASTNIDNASELVRIKLNYYQDQ